MKYKCPDQTLFLSYYTRNVSVCYIYMLKIDFDKIVTFCICIVIVRHYMKCYSVNGKIIVK